VNYNWLANVLVGILHNGLLGCWYSSRWFARLLLFAGNGELKLFLALNIHVSTREKKEEKKKTKRKKEKKRKKKSWK